MPRYGNTRRRNGGQERSTKKERWRDIEEKHNLQFEIGEHLTEIEEARDLVRGLLDRGVHPTITIPEEYVEKVKKHGIRPIKKSTGKGVDYSVVAGRLGADPYLPKDKKRYVAIIDPKGLRVNPRFTGPDRMFQGTVEFPTGVPPQNINIVGKFNIGSFRNHQKKQGAAA